MTNPLIPTSVPLTLRDADERSIGAPAELGVTGRDRGALRLTDGGAAAHPSG